MTREPAVRLYADEIIVDSFAGGGGASLGIEMALGRSPDIAINHDAEAIAMHKVNHPATKHYCEDVWHVDPVAACAGRRVGLMWLSPDCKHFSKAKGGKPVEKKIRGLAWIAVKWAKTVKPRVIALENVEEFQDWGPVLDNGRPCPERRGRTFMRFVRQLRNSGYDVEWRELVAADYGAPTTRKRLFLVARCDGEPIVWPERTHAPKARGGLTKWRTAAECIQWELPCPSIFSRTRPLAENTMKRIARGIQRYVIDTAEPFIVPLTHQGGDRIEGIADPMKTVTGAHRGEKALIVPFYGLKGDETRAKTTDDPLPTQPAENRFALVTPFVAGVGGRMGQSPERSVELPVQTITAKGDAALITPFLARTAHGEHDASGKKRGRGEHDANEPLPTVLASPDFAIVTPFLTEHANASSPRSFAADEPLRTQCAQVKGGHFALVSPTLIGAGGPEYSGKPVPVDQPMGTQTAENHRAVVSAFLKPRYGEREGQEPRCRSIEDPAPTIVPTGNGGDLVAAHLVKHYGGHEATGTPIPQPVDTITAQDHHALATSHLVKLKGTSKDGQPIDAPLHTIQAGGLHYGEVRAFLTRYNATSLGQKPDHPLSTIDTTDRFGLVTVAGEHYVIADIGMRMLQPRELFRAQGFHEGYIIDRDVDGKPFTKTAQVRMCGNSVCPPLAAAIVTAQFESTRQERVA